MAILVGVQPGGKGNFAVCALYWQGRLPALCFEVRQYSGVDEVLAAILGVSGEWGGLGALAVAAPLSWSGTPSGWRKCDRQLLKNLPSWAPKSWLRPPNTLPGAISVQGPALTWALAKETKLGNLPAHDVVETMPRLSLARLCGDAEQPVLGYRRREVPLGRRRDHVKTLLHRLIDPGIVALEQTAGPQSADGLDALVAAVTALAVAVPDAGLVTSELQGGDIRPVGKRQVVLLEALP